MDKKRAAALAGVMYYLQQEAAEREAESVRLGMCSRRSGWSVYGRKAVARGRTMVQGRRIRRFLAGVYHASSVHPNAHLEIRKAPPTSVRSTMAGRQTNTD